MIQFNIHDAKLRDKYYEKNGNISPNKGLNLLNIIT